MQHNFVLHNFIIINYIIIRHETRDLRNQMAKFEVKLDGIEKNFKLRKQNFLFTVYT
jgi:hypothetical protein